MSSQSRRIALTVRLPNPLYAAFHAKARRQGQDHNKVLNLMVEHFVQGGEGCVCPGCAARALTCLPSNDVSAQSPRRMKTL